MAWRRKRKWRGVRKPGATRKDPNVTVLVKREKVSNSSVNRDLALISAALGRLVRLGHLDRNAMARVKKAREPTKTRSVLSKEECGKLLDACDPHLRIFCLGALLTGARPCELRAVTWGDVNFGMKTMTIFRTKVGVGDAIPLHPELARELKLVKRRWAKKGKRPIPDDEPVFLSSKGRPNWDHRWSWRKALKGAGLHRRKGLTLYSLRHSFATHYLERGSPADLQQLMGHSSYTTTERYVRAVAERARAGIEALDVAG
jgi:integrase